MTELLQSGTPATGLDDVSTIANIKFDTEHGDVAQTSGETEGASELEGEVKVVKQVECAKRSEAFASSYEAAHGKVSPLFTY